MWAGRFSKELDEGVNDFNSSIRFDARMYPEDIEGSLAHANMLHSVGILTDEDYEQIKAGLEGIFLDLQEGTLQIDPKAEDIHMFVEAELTARIGNAGKRLHTARSRNDQVATDLRLYLRRETEEIDALLVTLIETISALAEKELETVLPGYTHMQRGQPVTLAHHLLAYAQMFLRDRERVREAGKRMNENPLGSCALAGTTYPIDRFMTAELLGFSKPTSNSMDGVSDRDFCMELGSDLAILMVHMSRLSEEIILWCSWEFKFVELDDSFATGSSIMPQKKNPDITELIRGKSGRVIGNSMSLLSMMKGQPLAYNKDMQEDKEAIFDSVDTVKLCMKTLIPMLETMTPLRENMYAAAAKGFINATDCADYLVKKGMPFREAYGVTGRLVAHCIDTQKDLETLPIGEYRVESPLFEEDVYEAISLKNCVEERKSYGGPSPESVKVQLSEIKTRLETF